MRRKGNLRGLSRLISVLLAFSLLSGLCVQAAAKGPGGAGAASGAISLMRAQTYALDAREGAQVDKNILAFALREAQKVVESGLLDQLTPSAPAGLKERFLKAIRDAENVYNDPDATNAEIQAAYLELQEVMWLLSYVRADKTALQAAVDHAKSIDLSDYTEDSVRVFQEALTAAQALLENDDLNMGDQGRIDVAILALETAESQLVLRPVETTSPEPTVSQPVETASPEPSASQPVETASPQPSASQPVETASPQPSASQPVETASPQPSASQPVETVNPQPVESTNPQPSVIPPSNPQPSDDPGKEDEKKPDAPSIKYNDVRADAWYAEGVEYVSSLGIMNGTGIEQFSPKAATSRAMIWTMLYRLVGEPEQSGDGSAWYDKAMRWVQENGISDGSNPNSVITREQLAVTLYRYAGSVKTDFDLSAYRDGAEISGWAQEGMMWAVETGLINGRGNGILDPKGTATRAEAATIFMRFMQNLQNSKEEIG